MLDHRRPARHGCRCSSAGWLLASLPVEPIEQRREAVQVIEVLEQAEAIDLRQVRVRLVLRERRRHLDRDLLVADGGLERRLIGGDEPVDQRLLVLLDAPDARERRLQVAVHARAACAEAHRLRLDAVHQDHAHARERVVVELADGRPRHLAPGEHLAIERHPFFGENIQAHGHLRAAKVRPRRATATGCVALGDGHGRSPSHAGVEGNSQERVSAGAPTSIDWASNIGGISVSPAIGSTTPCTENRKPRGAVLAGVAALLLLGCSGGAERCGDCPGGSAGGRIFSTTAGGDGAAGMRGGGGFAGTFTASGTAGSSAGTTGAGGQAGDERRRWGGPCVGRCQARPAAMAEPRGRRPAREGPRWPPEERAARRQRRQRRRHHGAWGRQRCRRGGCRIGWVGGRRGGSGGELGRRGRFGRRNRRPQWCRRRGRGGGRRWRGRSWRRGRRWAPRPQHRLHWRRHERCRPDDGPDRGGGRETGGALERRGRHTWECLAVWFRRTGRRRRPP